MPDRDSWNAFDEAQAEAVKQAEGLGDVCRDEIQLFEQTIVCRKVHRQGEVEHEAMINDDSGLKTVRVTWK